MVNMNRKKKREWDALTPAQQIEYQTDKEAREREGNERLDFRFAY